jgi:hypothetical protein
MLKSIGEWFWRGEALKRARAATDATARAEAASATDLVEAATSLGNAEGTLLAHGLLLSAATLHAAKALKLEVNREALLGEGAVRTRLQELRVTKDEVDAASRAVILDGGASELPKTQDVAALRQVADVLSRDAARQNQSAASVHVQRWVRLGAVAALFGVFVFLGFIHPWWLRDKARGATWVASSAFPEPGNTIQGTLGWPSSDYFFCTNEEDNPWVIIDLGKVKSFSRIRVVNRLAGSQERAYPLKIEVSHDKETWKTVAERPDTFDVWVVDLPDTEKARYLRLSLGRKTWFHLNTVQLY